MMNFKASKTVHWNKNILKKLEDSDIVEHTSDYIEKKFKILNQVDNFKNKDKKLSKSMEEFQDLLSDDLKEKFDDIMRLVYLTEDYYFTLAYFL